MMVLRQPISSRAGSRVVVFSKSVRNADPIGVVSLTFLCWPAAAFEAEWVKSPGAVVPPMNEIFLRLHDRCAEQPGPYGLVPDDPLALLQQFATVAERYPCFA